MNNTIRKITKKEYDKLIDSKSNGKYKPFGLFYLKDDDDTFITIDNSTGCCWVEEFKNLPDAKDWLDKKELSKWENRLNKEFEKLIEIEKKELVDVIKNNDNIEGCCHNIHIICEIYNWLLGKDEMPVLMNQKENIIELLYNSYMHTDMTFFENDQFEYILEESLLVLEEETEENMDN